MDKIKQNIDLQEAIQRYNIEKSVVGTLAYNIDQNLQKGMSVDEAIENVLNKSEGEGSRGGKVIGHTKSGKPIYEGGEHHKLMQSSFNLRPEEHLRTAKILRQKAAKIKAGLKDGASANVTLRELERRAKIHEDVYAMRTQKSFEDTLQKSKSLPIGTIHIWKGKKFKKQPNGKWVEVSEHGMTSREHTQQSIKLQSESHKEFSPRGKEKKFKESLKHQKYSDKISDKEYSDEEVTGGEKKEEGSKSIKQMIIEAPIGSKASGGGYSDWTKTGNNSWKNSTTNSLSHDEGLFDRIGGFSDFKINKTKKSFQDTLFKSEQTEAQKAKVKKVVEEFNKGILKSSTGELITDRSEALRFALSEAGIDIQKGIYVNNKENQKLGRVGQKYGSKKDDESDFKIINDASSVSALMTPIWGNKSKGFLYFTDGLRVDIPTINERLNKSGDRKLVSLLDVIGTNGENQQDPHTFKNDKIANSFSVRVNKKGRFELLQHKID